MYSCNQAQIGAGKLAFKQPVAEVDGQVYLLALVDFWDYNIGRVIMHVVLDVSPLLVALFHIHSYEFVADLRCMLRVVV